MPTTNYLYLLYTINHNSITIFPKGERATPNAEAQS